MVVVVVGTWAIVIVKSRVAVTPVLSVAVTVKLNVPGVVGVPEIDPSGASVRPGGSPDADQVSGVFGVVPSSAAEYGDPACRPAASWW